MVPALVWAGSPTYPAGSSALASLELGGNEIAVSGAGGSCSHSLRQTHSSVRLIGPEWRHKRPPMDTLRLVIKLQAFVLLSVPPLPLLCLPASSWLPTRPLSLGASPHTLKNWLGATIAYRTETEATNSPSVWTQLQRVSGDLILCAGFLVSECGWGPRLTGLRTLKRNKYSVQLHGTTNVLGRKEEW